jgi:MFS family permease
MGGGFVVQSFVADWFHTRWHANLGLLGDLFFCANLLAGFSALAAGAISTRIGLVNTMVATHLPSNVLLILVPLMPTKELAAIVLLLRFSISQMDVPTRQSYTMAVVPPEERAAAAGVTNVVRSTGAAIGQAFAGSLYAAAGAMAGLPFIIAGGLKIVYDVLLYRRFISVKPPEER